MWSRALHLSWSSSLGSPGVCEEVGSNLRTSNVPDTSIDKVMMNIDQRYKHESIRLKSSIGVIEGLVDPHKHEEARGA